MTVIVIIMAALSIHKGSEGFLDQASDDINDKHKMEGVLVAGEVPVNVQRAGGVLLGPAMS